MITLGDGFARWLIGALGCLVLVLLLVGCGHRDDGMGDLWKGVAKQYGTEKVPDR